MFFSLFLSLLHPLIVAAQLHIFHIFTRQHSQGFQAAEASEHASLDSCQLVSSQEQFQDFPRSIESTFTDVLQLVVAQVAAEKKNNTVIKTDLCMESYMV